MTLAQQFDSMDLQAIRHFVESAQVEDLHLDFKTVAGQPLTREDRKNLAIALSGFANSDGGLIVWGVDCRRNEDGVDCAQRVAPVNDVTLLLSDLNTMTGHAVNPMSRACGTRQLHQMDGKALW